MTSEITKTFSSLIGNATAKFDLLVFSNSSTGQTYTPPITAISPNQVNLANRYISLPPLGPGFGQQTLYQ